MKNPESDDILSHLTDMMTGASQFEQPPLPALPQGAIYPAGLPRNFIYPANYSIPSFCDGCPLVQDMKKPQISRVDQALYPVNTKDVVEHIGPFADYVNDVLVLDEAGKPEIAPVYLGEIGIGDPFSVQHESPESIALGTAHRKVNRCRGPQTQKRFLRKEKILCMSGLVKVQNYPELSIWYPSHNLVVPTSKLGKDVIVEANK